MTISESQMTRTEVRFRADDFRLTGSLFQPSRDTDRIVIGCHGLLSDRTSPKQLDLARKCVAMGIAYFAFDHRGCGESEGDFAKVTTLGARCRDLMAAVTFIRTEVNPDIRIGLFGSSMGGAVCLATAGRIRPWAIVTVAAPIKSASIVLTEKNALDTGNFPPSFYQETLQFDITDNLTAVSNLLLFHGDADDTVPFSHAREIYSLVTEPKKFIPLKGGDHRMSNPSHQEEFIRKAAAWYRRRLGADSIIA